MLRYLRRLADRDFALDRGHDPARLLHDEAQRHHRDGADHLAGVRRRCTRSPRTSRPRASAALVDELSGWLCEITGYDAVSLQPNAGSQGELAGLLAIAPTTARAATTSAPSASSRAARTAPTPPAP